MIKNFFTKLILIFSLTIFFAGCGNSDSPEKSLSEIQTALEQRNFEKLSERVDAEKFFSQTYDDMTIELAKNYEAYQKKYPEDPYFQHSADFLKDYNFTHKDLHLNFLEGVKNAYFEKLPEPATPEENPYAYVANEFEKIRQASTAVVKEIEIDGDKAVMTVEMQGDSSIRGQFIGTLNFKISFDKDKNDNWRLNKIENLDELTPPLVDKAEIVWITFFQ